MRNVYLCVGVCFSLLLYIVAKVGLVYVVRHTLSGELLQPGVPEDASAGIAPLEDDLLSATRSDAYRSAAKALRDGDFTRALAELQGCITSDASCQGLAAEMHLSGAGVPKNLTEALQLFQAAADRGDADSQYALGVLYLNILEDDSERLERNEALSVLYMYAASVAGHHGALMAMGYRHAEGLGVPKTCGTAALNYIEVARKVADVYSAGMPQAVELVRLGVERERQGMSASEMTVFVEIAASGDANIAAAVGKRYLLGIDGFKQDYQRAARHLETAAAQSHGTAMGLLGYMHSLGLGVEKDLDKAFSNFQAAAAQDDALGHNGLGFIYFKGTDEQKQDSKQAFEHFNISAHLGSADGMFNLASLYLTGTGTEQSFQRASLWYTQALDRGHTPAAYTLAVMHLNGIGTVRNCNMAVELLKRVCERGSWVSNKLREAQDMQTDGRSDAAAWLFLRLAESGHEVAQMNVAHLFDTGASTLMANISQDGSSEGSDTEKHLMLEDPRLVGRIHSQRHYELSAEQGNAYSELRLGDFAFFGYGLKLQEGEEWEDRDGLEEDCCNESLKLVRQEPDMELSMAHYRRTAAMRITGEWMQPFVARANFNLGYMHQFGVGVRRDIPMARRYYAHVAEVDPGGVQAPVGVMLALLNLQAFLEQIPTAEELLRGWMADIRLHVLLVHILAVCGLLLLKRSLSQRARAAAPAPARESASSSSVIGSAAEGAEGLRRRRAGLDAEQDTSTARNGS